MVHIILAEDFFHSFSTIEKTVLFEDSDSGLEFLEAQIRCQVFFKLSLSVIHHAKLFESCQDWANYGIFMMNY